VTAIADCHGTVVSNFGRRALVEDAAGERHQCLLSSRSLRPVTGDHVVWRPATPSSQPLLLSVEERRNALVRPNNRGKVEVLAANITQVVIVVAPSPEPDPFIVDRYIAAAEFMTADAAIVCNKRDLIGANRFEFDAELDVFAALGYPTLLTSAVGHEGLGELRDLLQSHTSILVGQSGTGKSSLLNALLPDLDLATQSVSAALGEGRHTTTASTLYHLDNGGRIIDSPGVRDYAPGQALDGQVQQGFVEIEAASQRCRFHNCVHMKEPGCAVIEAVTAQTISPRRYESYRRLLRLGRDLSRQY
jgi:ribosome biogenesis GTPase